MIRRGVTSSATGPRRDGVDYFDASLPWPTEAAMPPRLMKLKLERIVSRCSEGMCLFALDPINA